MRQISNRSLKKLLIFFDIILFHVALFAALIIRQHSIPSFDFLLLAIQFFFVPHCAWIVLLYFLDFYELPLKTLIPLSIRAVSFGALALAIGSSFFYFFPNAPFSPKTILLMDILFAVCGIIVYRWAAQRYEVSFPQHVIVIGNRQVATLYAEVLLRNNYSVLIYDPATDAVSLDDLQKEIHRSHISSVILALDREREREMIHLIYTSLPLSLRYLDSSDFHEQLFYKVPLHLLEESWFLKNISAPPRRFYELAKRAFDLVCAIVGGMILLITLPFVACAIKLSSPGPLFYAQTRTGLNGKSFTVYKFRTMRVDAEAQGPQLSGDTDNRATSIGTFLRRTHVDELPQVINIFRGDISVTGPRPERPEFLAAFDAEIPFHKIRLLVKPGLTGWAQVYYKAPTSVREAQERLAYDLYYIKNRSLVLDAKIILKTIQLIVLKKDFRV